VEQHLETTYPEAGPDDPPDADRVRGHALIPEPL
jgi:hypothetical protein